MKNTVQDFLRGLEDLDPRIRELIRENISYNGEVLPHVIMGDVTRYFISVCDEGEGAEAVDAILDYFEQALGINDGEIEELISVSFVENLLGENCVKNLKHTLGPKLSAVFSDVVPNFDTL